MPWHPSRPRGNSAHPDGGEAGQGAAPRGRSLDRDRIPGRGPPRPQRAPARPGPSGHRSAGWVPRCAPGLYRPLAGDDDRVAYWIRHVRIGVLLSEIAAWPPSSATSCSPTARAGTTRSSWPCAAWSSSACPLLLLLPLAAMMRDSRGPTMFYLWSIATSTLVIVGTRLDGGPSSPLDALLFLTLTFLAVAYSPYGVVVMGSLMTAAYLLFVELPGLTTSGLFFLAVMVAFTMVCAMASANSWAAYDRQVLLIRTQETLASTDPLTGIPNRRAYLERVADGRRRRRVGPPDRRLPRRPRRVQGRQRRRRARRRRRDAHAVGQPSAAPSGRPTPSPGSVATSSPSWPTSRWRSPARCSPSASGTPSPGSATPAA